MKKIVLVMVLLMTTLTCGLGWAGEISESTLNKLITLSGLSKQVLQIPDEVKAGLEQARQQEMSGQQPTMPADEYNELKNVISNAFQASIILQAINNEVRGAVSEQDAQAMFAWYESEPGITITKAEEEASSVAAYQEMTASAQTLLADEKRVQIAKSMDELLQLTDMMLQLQENTAVAMYLGFSPVTEQPVKIDEFREQVAAGLQNARPNIERFLILFNTYTYRNIDVASLEKYISFLKTPGSMQFNKGVMKGMVTGLNQAINNMAKSLPDLASRWSQQQGSSTNQRPRSVTHGNPGRRGL